MHTTMTSSTPFSAAEINTLKHAVSNDRQLSAFCQPTVNTLFAIQALPSPPAYIVRVANGSLSIENSAKEDEKMDFTLQATHQVWNKFLQTNQELGYVAGILRAHK
jgi:hypothetical protein